MSAKAAKKFRKEARKFIEEHDDHLRKEIRNQVEIEVFEDLNVAPRLQRLKFAWMIITGKLEKIAEEAANAEQEQESSDRY